MFAHLLVPLDGSTLAEAALPAASYLAGKLHARVTLLHLIEGNAPSQVHGERHLQTVEEAEAYLRDAARRCFSDETALEIHVHTAGINDVARGILDHAAESDYDLVVMCAHGRGGLRQFVLGGIAQKVVKAGHKPVLLIPAQERPVRSTFQLRLIEVALDTDNEHARALAPAAELAQACGATLHLVTVIPTMRTLPVDEAFVGKLMPLTAAALLEQDEERAAAFLNTRLEPIRHEGITATISVRRGDPATVIVDTAEKSSADLIALGTHGPGGVEAFLEGSVARKVVGRTHTPLLLVPVGKD